MAEKKKVCQWIWLVACMIAVVAGGIYYYGILHAFVPCSEDLGTTQRWYLILHQGQPYYHGNLIFDMVSCLSVLIGGMSYFSLRLSFTLCYMVILVLSLYLSICGKEHEKVQWYLLPLWAFFMVFVHTINAESEFGKTLGPLAYQLPYAYHNIPTISALGCVILMQCYLHAKTVKSKTVIIVSGTVAVVYSMLHTDLIYYVIFIVPVAIVLVIRGIYSDKARKYVGRLCLIGVMAFLLTRFLSGELFQAFWGKDKFVGQYDGIYGATSWLDLDDIMQHITNYVRMVMMLFNIELSNREVLSFYSVLFMTRMILVLIGYVITAKVLACSIKGDKRYSVIDEVLAWAFVILSGVAAFTKHGINPDCIRYFSALVPILTILLCRNIVGFMMDILPLCGKIRYKKWCFAGMLCVLCICQAEPVWSYKEEDCYLADCEAAIDYIQQWGGEYAIASYWLRARLSAMTKGEILFFASEQEIKDVYGEDASAKYVVVGWEGGIWFRQGLESIAYGSYEEMCEKYKAPVRAVDLDYFYVCEFED